MTHGGLVHRKGLKDETLYEKLEQNIFYYNNLIEESSPKRTADINFRKGVLDPQGECLTLSSYKEKVAVLNFD